MLLTPSKNAAADVSLDGRAADEKGYSFDAIVVEDDPGITRRLSLEEQFQRFLYAGDARNIIARFVAGRQVG